MALWGKNDFANNSPQFALTQVNVTPNAANANALFGNTTTGVWLNNGVPMKVAVGQFGVSAAETANTFGEGKDVAHAGWNLRTCGTGPLTGITLGAAGSGHTNNAIFTVVAGPGGANTVGRIIVNGALGNIVAVNTSVLITAGNNFNSATPTVLISNTSGTGGSITATAGGRAGRVQYETLVAMGSITGDAADDTQLPE